MIESGISIPTGRAFQSVTGIDQERGEVRLQPPGISGDSGLLWVPWSRDTGNQATVDFLHRASNSTGLSMPSRECRMGCSIEPIGPARRLLAVAPQAVDDGAGPLAQ